MATCTRRLEFDAAHRVPGHGGKCRTLHGHRYVVDITCTGVVQEDGMIVDFGVIKDVVGEWVDNSLDHTTILWRGDSLAKGIEESFKGMPGDIYWMTSPPTAENLAELLVGKAGGFLKDFGIEVQSVRVYETPNCWADACSVQGGPTS